MLTEVNITHLKFSLESTSGVSSLEQASFVKTLNSKHMQHSKTTICNNFCQLTKAYWIYDGPHNTISKSSVVIVEVAVTFTQHTIQMSSLASDLDWCPLARCQYESTEASEYQEI